MYKAPLDTQDPRLLQRAKDAFLRKQFLANMIAATQNEIDGWRWPRIKAPSKTYPQYSNKECERRRNQWQHRNQVVFDRIMKKQPVDMLS